MNWKILGIKETKDKAAIKNAYREVLSTVNPEDDPEKFKELRKAYEEALTLADQGEEENDNTPVGIWLKKVENVYDVFSKRLDENEWKNLINDDVCQQFDTRIEARDRLLGYIMDHYYFPRFVWLILNDAFDLLENKDALYEEFPKDFVDYCVISGIENIPIVKYELFEVDDRCDYETFIAKFFEFRRKVRNRDYEDCDRLLTEIDELEIFHPYLEAERTRYYLSQDRIQEAKTLIDDVYEKFPEETPVIYMCAEVSYSLENYQEAADLYAKILELEPQHYYARVGLADCYMYLKKFIEAKSLYIEVIRENSYDNYVRDKLDKINEELFSFYEDKINENPDDIDSRFELGWCYLQNMKCKDCIDLFDEIKIPDDRNLEYYNIMSRVYHENSENDKSWDMLLKWKKAIENGEHDKDNKDENEEQGKEPEENPIIKILYLQGCIKEEQNEYEKAEEFFDEIIKLDENNTEAYIRKAVLLNNMNKYENTIDICNKINELDSSNFTGHYQKAIALFELGYYYDALDEFEESINVYPYFLDSYIYKIRIFFIYKEYDRVQEIIDYLDEQKIESTKLEFYKGRLLDCQDKIDEAMEVYENVVIKASNEETDMDRIEQVYYQMSIIEEEVRENRSKAYEYIEKALKANPNDVGSNAFYGNLLRKDKKFKEAIAQFEKVLSINPMHRFAYNEIGNVYEDMDDNEKALEYHTKQLDNDDGLYYRIHRGLVYMSLDRFDEARADFNISIELDSSNPNSYNNIGVCYQYEDNLEEALKYYEKTIETLDNEPFDKIYRNMATTYTRLFKYDEAIECYKRCIEKFNVTYDYYEMASIYKLAGKYDKARETLKEWIMKRDDTTESAYYYQEIAVCYYQEGNDEECMKNLKKAYEIDSKDGDTLEWLGYMHKKNKNYLKAIYYYEKFLKVRPDSEHIYDELTDSYKNAKINFKAKKCAANGVEKLLKISEVKVNRRKVKYLHLGEVYTSIGDFDNAKKSFEKCLSIRKCGDCNYKKCADVLYAMGEMYEKLNDIKKANECYKEALDSNPNDRDMKEAYKRTSQK